MPRHGSQFFCPLNTLRYVIIVFFKKGFLDLVIIGGLNVWNSLRLWLLKIDMWKLLLVWLFAVGVGLLLMFFLLKGLGL